MGLSLANLTNVFRNFIEISVGDNYREIATIHSNLQFKNSVDNNH